ncbi:C40 family peptidase [Kitasatospora sp. GAS204B]|uniref:C40 family peptidase n=1 Tax=unclassified Kitasatospora TaxID=2633591 RepID=UPI002473C74C|nr:NlpC/P60 family protein [Kitasatospora sp. GAS204B]MDH6119263.1 cell wall-associated NlpC family hydrolase [Kitasatospora sp. GAS204B]
MSATINAKLRSAFTTLACLLLLLAGPPLAAWAGAADGRAGPRDTGDCAPLTTGASATAESAVRAACGQLGVWYTWGGGHGPDPGATYGHPDGVDPASDHDNERLGFDCSGLVRYAYAQATGTDLLNGDAGQQFYTLHAAERFTPGQGSAPLLPGDLLAYGSSDNLHHIAIYLGAGKMVEARQSGTHIMVSDARLDGDYFGAVRINPGPVTGITEQTWSTGVWTHVQPSADSPRVYAFPDATTVRVSCQEHAQSITAEGITNDAWSFLPDYQAWISNIYLQGPAWLDSVPTC